MIRLFTPWKSADTMKSGLYFLEKLIAGLPAHHCLLLPLPFISSFHLGGIYFPGDSNLGLISSESWQKRQIVPFLSIWGILVGHDVRKDCNLDVLDLKLDLELYVWVFFPQTVLITYSYKFKKSLIFKS